MTPTARNLLIRLGSEGQIRLTAGQGDGYSAALELEAEGLLRAVRTGQQPCCIFVLSGEGVAQARELHGR